MLLIFNFKLFTFNYVICKTSAGDKRTDGKRY